MTTNKDTVLDALIEAAHDATNMIALKMDMKDQMIDNLLIRTRELEHQLDVVTAALVKERGCNLSI